MSLSFPPSLPPSLLSYNSAASGLKSAGFPGPAEKKGSKSGGWREGRGGGRAGKEAAEIKRRETERNDEGEQRK